MASVLWQGRMLLSIFQLNVGCCYRGSSCSLSWDTLCLVCCDNILERMARQAERSVLVMHLTLVLYTAVFVKLGDMPWLQRSAFCLFPLLKILSSFPSQTM